MNAEPDSQPLDLPERILQAAYDCFEQHGIARTSIEKVAAMAKVSRPTVYKYFGGKDALLDEISVRETYRINAEVRRRLVKRDDFAEFLTDTLILVVTLADKNIYIRRMVESIEFQRATGAKGSMMLELQQTWWGRMIDQAKARGQVAADVSTDEVVEWLGHAQSMILVRLLPNQDEATMRRFVRRFVVEPLLAVHGAAKA